MRVDDLEKISAQVCPASGLCWLSAALRFLRRHGGISARMMFHRPARDSFSKLSRCFMRVLAQAARFRDRRDLR